MTKADIEARYERARTERQATLAARDRAHARFGYVRLLLAASGIALLLIGGLDWLVWTLVPLAIFVGVAVAHGRLLNARDDAASAVGFYERGLARIRHAWIGRGRTGDDWRPADHLYAEDLDLFGRGSLFELLATTRTRAGEETIAAWMLAPATPDDVARRQDAVRELADRLDLRERIAVLGDQLRVGVDADLLRRWASAPITLQGRARRASLAILVAASTVALATWAWTGTAGDLALGLIAGQVLVAQWLKARVQRVIHAVDEPSHDLELLASLLSTIERESFHSAHLQALRQAIGTGDARASSEIARLARLVSLLSSRRNVLFAPVSALWLWATQWAFAIDAWRARAGRHIPEWLAVVGEFEAVLALAGFAAEHPGFVFPDVATGAPALAATGIAHPVLAPDAVTNDLAIGRAAPTLVIVSGSNMSGKSTLLRALGVNVVLAQMGAPVRARAFTMTPLAIGASISVHDSLTDGRSRFFAEITRLKHIVDLSDRPRGAVLFLLDEILSGTNSHDRRIGAEALLTGLVRRGAVGLVTTHDLALGDIATRLPERAVNMHFADHFEQGALDFDYTLRPGVVRTSNALALMRSIGLEVEPPA